MTRFELISNIESLSKFLVFLNKGNTICGQCHTDRKLCNVEINTNCIMQYLQSDKDVDFKCDYKKV